MIDGDDDLMLLGCLGPELLSALGKAALVALFLYALLSTLGLWAD